MARLFPIRASRLIQRPMRLPEERRTLSVFPFFNRDGSVRAVVAVDAEAGELRVIDDLQQLRLPLLRRPRLLCNWADLRELDSFAELSETWHYDPAYVARPMVHPLRDTMLTTNCADEFTCKVGDVYFDGRLNRIHWVLLHKSSGETSLSSLEPDHLPPPPVLPEWPSSVPLGRGPRWVLSPIWERQRG